MSDEIKPALTAEEWKEELAGHRYFETGPRRIGDGQVFLDGVTLSVVYDCGYGVTPLTNRHAAAALALHGQDFGFTRADVRLLEGIADPYEDWADNRLLLRSLAARIRALLPPEEK